MWKRALIVILAGWVLFSGYAWPHTRAHLINNWVMGLGLAVFGTLSMVYGGARYVTLAIGVWLFAFAALFNRLSAVTYWSDAMVAVAVFVLSLVSSPSAAKFRRRTA